MAQSIFGMCEVSRKSDVELPRPSGSICKRLKKRGRVRYRFGPMKFESLALSLSKGFDRLSLNRYLDFNGPDQYQVPHPPLADLYCRPPYFCAATRTRAFGTSPNISGAYKASTRLGGKEKSPALFRRTVYSILTLPLGRYS